MLTWNKSLLWASLFVASSCHAQFSQLTDFGDNPGELTANVLTINKGATANLVLLHGCTQQGTDLATDSGFVALAQRYNFNLLLPQQSTSNNVQGCFNWFSPADTSKDQGELLSLKNMINAYQQQTQAEQTYLVGLSAGGAMANVLMHTYPDMFDGVGVIAGIPFNCAHSLTEAISCMRNGPTSVSKKAKSTAQTNTTNGTHLPKLTVWTGTDDQVVNRKNASFTVEQWLTNNGLSLEKILNQKSGITRSRWQTNEADVVLELVEIDDLGHGMMVKPDSEFSQTTGSYLLNAPISAAVAISEFFQLDAKEISNEKQ
ncbi:PHB depolymerase family esterase [Thalassotalea ponticola]|uniref:extracellular catalytic domain type 1 short-chain-length polyhydroxyalkanoate depolymerase n=1 Tax=Thalassotalea ponticola TaxID=1523392 RepID=UPI0025B372C0|nr:PHB depolymerase family esterase [Thalassotalea ponticola]MDN3653137.1 PHB depolymerase family esterase [Thalassotalea ponticola]